MLSIKISNLSDGTYNYKFEEPVEDVELEEPFFGNVLVEAELQKALGQIVLNADISVNAALECDRCIKDFSSLIKTKYQMVYLFESEAEESDSIHITYLNPDADVISLKNDVRDFATLAVPMKKLCKDDCKGLCQKCGKDLNEVKCTCTKESIDPRWQPLLELKNKLNIN